MDFKLTEDGDLYIDPVTKDLVIADSERQHIKDILTSAPGHFKEFPLVGFNPYKRLNARVNKQEINNEAKLQLQSDGYTVKRIDLDLQDGTVIINALDVSR